MLSTVQVSTVLPKKSLISHAVAAGAADAIWKRRAPIGKEESCEALKGVLQYVFSSSGYSHRQKGRREPLAPLHWAKRLIQSGADIDTPIQVRYVASTTKNGSRDGARVAPSGLKLNTRIKETAEADGWQRGRGWGGSNQYSKENQATEVMSMTLAELAAITITPALMTAIPENADVKYAHTAVAKWTEFWTAQWAQTAPVMDLPWNNHGSMLDFALYQGLFSPVQMGQNKNTTEALFNMAKSLGKIEVDRGQGWWTRPASVSHPWPAWEIAVQLNAFIRKSSHARIPGSELGQTLLDILPAAEPIPSWAVEDAARAVIDEALEHTTFTTCSNGPKTVNSVSKESWAFVESLGARLPEELRPAIANWMEETRNTLRVLLTEETPDGKELGKQALVAIREKLTLLIKVFPTGENESDLMRSGRSRKM